MIAYCRFYCSTEISVFLLVTPSTVPTHTVPTHTVPYKSRQLHSHQDYDVEILVHLSGVRQGATVGAKLTVPAIMTDKYCSAYF